MQTWIRASVLAAVVGLDRVDAHGSLTLPPPRHAMSMVTAGWCQGENPLVIPQSLTCVWHNSGSQIGCPVVTNDDCTEPNNCCEEPMNPTITGEGPLRTYIAEGQYGYTPWRAPGFAPVGSPCGLAGGGERFSPGNLGIAPFGIRQGMPGSELPVSANPAVWRAGGEAEVGWAVNANHGGGYSYRLCPRDSELSEECFQKQHLEFVGDSSWIQYGADFNNRTEFTTLRTNKGTYPDGSTWTRNPIPSCVGHQGRSPSNPCVGPFNYEPPIPGLYGYGAAQCDLSECTDEEREANRNKFNFSIIDKVKVPAGLRGEYVLSWRWDSEGTPQVWANCADVNIV